VLADARVEATVPTADLDRARAFDEGTAHTLAHFVVGDVDAESPTCAHAA
jgi:hypothetical protein